MRRFVLCGTCIILPFLLAVPSGGESPVVASQDNETWTILTYMAADGDPDLPWEDDINEMEASDGSTDVSVLVLVDPDGPGNSMILEIVHDENIADPAIVSTVVDDSGEVISGGEVNTGSPTTLQDFIVFGASEYPADRYVLLLWGHGGGWWGLCPDGSDILTLEELDSALDAATSSIGRDLDMVIVDACAEAVVETMYQIRGHAGLLVASERGVPIQGLPYKSILDELAADPSMSPSDFGRVICDEYADWAWFYSSYSVSMGVFELGALDALVARLDEFSLHGLRFEQLFHESFHSASLTAESYEMENYIDLGSLMLEMLERDLPLEIHRLAIDVLCAYDDLVDYLRVYSHPDPVDGVYMPEATGTVMYLPSSSLIDSDYAMLEIAVTDWDQFAMAVRETTSPIPNGPAPELSLTDSDDDGRPDSASLVWTGDYSSVSAWVFRDGGEGLVLEQVHESGSNWVQIGGIVGALSIGASAEVDGVSRSYHIVNASLFGFIEVRVVMDHLGEYLAEGYELELATSKGSFPFERDGMGFVCRLEIPSSGEVGEVAWIMVRESASGTTVVQDWTVLRDGSDLIRIRLFEGEETRLSVPLLVLSLIPAGLIFLAAGALAIRPLRGRSPPRTSS